MKILLKQAIVYPITSQKFQGDVLVTGERITEVKPFIPPTQDMTVIDARALHLLPALLMSILTLVSMMKVLVGLEMMPMKHLKFQHHIFVL